MSTRRPFVKAANGLVHITDPALNFEALEDIDFDAAIERITRLRDVVAEWSARDKQADEDWDARRVVAFESTYHAAQSAADEVRDAAGFHLDWETSLAFSDEVAQSSSYARQQATKLTNPMLREA